MRNRATQKEAIFYRLYKRFKDAKPAPEGGPPIYAYTPVYELMGEIWIEELGKWGYVSYECSARASEMIKANPELIQRTTIKGRSGARYYGYRLNPRPHVDMIKDSDLLTFYRKISGSRTKTSVEASKKTADEIYDSL